MKAVVYTKYGAPDVLQIIEVPTPTPKDNEVRIKIHATTVTSADWRIRSIKMPVGFGLMSRLVFGINKPRQPILGSELAGEVESIGKDVSKFKVGDRVLFGKYAGQSVKVDGKEVLVMREDDIMGVVEK